jgi:uncharacterized protein (TIGR00297 family)
VYRREQRLVYSASLLLKMNDLREISGAALLLSAKNWWVSAAITLIFAGFGRVVRGVTRSGAIAGATVCFALIVGAGWAAFAALGVVFLLTWTATRIGSARKGGLGTSEARAGRNALQVLANIGVASVCALLYARFGDRRLLVCAGAALAEAAADTVSSEIGQALGGEPRLVTNWRIVGTGTDGAITLAGTFAGAAAAVAVALTCVLGEMFNGREFLVCIAAGMIGTFVDSLLGATIERRGWLGNNAVNFLSTLAAAATAFLVL